MDVQGGGDGARLAAEIAEAERQERERLAEALHDDALQRLLVVRQDLAEAPEDPAVVRSVGRQLTELTASLRSLTRAMHEDSLAAMPLHAALERLAEDAARRGRLVISTRVGPGAMGDHDAFVLGVVRELLTNVVKHAHATRAEIAITAEGDDLVVRVTDDGLGTSVDDLERAERSGHLGHARLRRRLAAIGGEVELDDEDRPGTTVICTLPVENLGAQRTLEEALGRERRWSAALVAAMQDGFVVFRDGRAVQVNDRFCAMTAFGRDELIDRPVEGSLFCPPEGREELVAVAREVEKAGGCERRVTLVKADGERFPALIAARAIFDEAGGATGLLLTVKDITALEHAAETRRLELELGAVVATTKRLRGLLNAARAVADEAGLDGLLSEIARMISEDLGWTVVINLYRPACDDFIVSTGHGISEEGWAVLRGATYEWTAWTPLLDDRFERRGAYLVPAGEPLPAKDFLSWTPPMVVLDVPDAWQPDDDLLIPFRHSRGHFLGIMSLDAPASGRRPSDAELDVLVAIAAHAALAVQHAQTAIESAWHAAALDSLLQVSSLIAATREITPMLEVVSGAVSEALGFGRVVVEVVGDDGLLRPQAGRDAMAPPDVPGWEAWPPILPQDLDGLLDPALAVEGCFLLGPEEAAGRMPAERGELLASRSNGRGWRAWHDHIVLVPLHGADDRVVGAIWVDDPVDRLLPGPWRLQALHAFANQATAAMIAGESYQRLASASDGDPLTQLGNRRSFLREIEREAARTARTGASSVLVLADVDSCATLELAADAPATLDAGGGLRELAAVFEAELRIHDRVFRIDGTLFAILLTGADSPETTGVTVRLAARLRSLGQHDGARVTFGTAVLGPGAEGAHTALRRAGDSLRDAHRLEA